jgi:hypothetical protein
VSRLIGLYPRPWRDRYEEELLLLISERPPTIGDRFDLIRGALDARLHPQVRTSAEAPTPSPVPDGDLRVARRLGMAAIVGAILWPAAFVVMATGPLVYDGDGAYRDGGAALPIFTLAVVLLAGGLIGQAIQLPANARLARGGALAAIPFLVLFGMGPWMWPLGLTAMLLLVALAVGSVRAGAWPMWASAAVVAASLGLVAIMAVGVVVADGDRMIGGAFFFVAGLAIVPAWLVLGATLVRPQAPAGTSPTGMSPA